MVDDISVADNLEEGEKNIFVVLGVILAILLFGGVIFYFLIGGIF